MKRIWKSLFLATLTIIGTNALALVRVSMNCPDQYTATVVQIDDMPTSKEVMMKQRIQLATMEVHSGEVSDLESIEILKYGPISLKEGDEISVATKNGLICSVDKQ